MIEFFFWFWLIGLSFISMCAIGAAVCFKLKKWIEAEEEKANSENK